MSLTTVSAGQPIRSTHINQFTRWITGATKDVPHTLITTSASEYTSTLTNEDTSAGLVAKWQYGAGTAAVTLGTINKTGVTFNVPLNAANPLAGLFTTTGDTAYSVSGATAARLPIGTVNQVLAVSSTGVPAWGASPATILSSSGDLLYASAANTPARLAVGTANQALGVNAAGTAPAYMASLQSLMASAGSLVVASAANTPAHLPKGATSQELIMNDGATGQTWATGVLARAVTAGDTFYATGLSAITRVAAGSAFQNWVMNGGATGATWASCALALAVTSGDLFYATGLNAVARLPRGTDNQYLRSDGTIPVWETVGAAASLDKITEVTLGGSTTIVAFTSISQSYRHLELWMSTRNSSAVSLVNIQFSADGTNFDGGANYDTVYSFANGTAVQCAGTIADSRGVIGASSNFTTASCGAHLRIPNYAGTTLHKNYISQSSYKAGTTADAIYVYSVSGFWRTAAAVQGIQVFNVSGSWATGSNFTLYGLPS